MAFKFVNYSAKIVVLKGSDGRLVQVPPGESLETSSANVAKQLKRIPEFQKPKLPPSKKPKKLSRSVKRRKKEDIKKAKEYFSFSVEPEVSVIILTKDFPELIIPCVESILKKVEYPNFKIIIADTGTKNKNTLDFYDKIFKRKNVEIRKNLNFHFGKNYNQLVEECKSPYVLLLNNDTTAQNDFVSEMMKYIQNSKVGMVGARLLYPDGNIQHVGQFIYNSDGDFLFPPSGPGHYLLGKNPKDYDLKNEFVDGVTAACMLVNRDLFISIGGFDENFNDLFQDVDFNLRMRNKGYKAFQCNDAILTHHDNYSRKKENNHISKIQADTDLYIEKWTKEGPPVSEMKEDKPFISFLTPVADKFDYLQFLNSINPGNKDHEFIFIRNRPEEAGLNSPQVLNLLNKIASGKYVAMCHEDIVLSHDWINKTSRHIKEIEEKDPDWGLIGVVGIGTEKDIRLGMSFLENDPNNWEAAGGEDIVECSGVLDEVCIISKNGECKFDESLAGFHFYGADISMTTRLKKNKSIYIINSTLDHKSGDGSKHLQKNDKWKEYTKLAKKFVKKWKGIDFATTTMLVEKGRITFWLAPRLGKEPFEKVY